MLYTMHCQLHVLLPALRVDVGVLHVGPPLLETHNYSCIIVCPSQIAVKVILVTQTTQEHPVVIWVGSG